MNLAGGEAALAEATQRALTEGNYKWAVELARELARIEQYKESGHLLFLLLALRHLLRSLEAPMVETTI